MGRVLTFCGRPGPRFGALSAVIHKLRSGNFLTRGACNGACRCCTVIDRRTFHGNALGGIVDGCFGGSCLDTMSSLIGRRSVSLSSLERLVSRMRQTGGWGGRCCKALFYLRARVNCLPNVILPVLRAITGREGLSPLRRNYPTQSSAPIATRSSS